MIRTLGRSALSVVFELGEISVFGFGAVAGFFAQRNRMAKLIQAIHGSGKGVIP